MGADFLFVSGLTALRSDSTPIIPSLRATILFSFGYRSTGRQRFLFIALSRRGFSGKDLPVCWRFHCFREAAFETERMVCRI